MWKDKDTIFQKSYTRKPQTAEPRKNLLYDILCIILGCCMHVFLCKLLFLYFLDHLKRPNQKLLYL
jgi:hypothetical protein